MSKPKVVSINGSYAKCESSWTANFPNIKVCSRGTSPQECVEALKEVLSQLNKLNPFDFNIEISDEGKLVMSSDQTDIFLEFLKARILLSHDSEKYLAELPAQSNSER